jgi:hypothetical protein
MLTRGRTYSFLFFGPGLPLGFNNPSAAIEALLPPFFLTTSVGGGIAVEPSVALGAGVSGLDSETFSSGDDVATGRVFDVVDDGAFGSASTLVSTASKGNCLRALGASGSLTRRLLGDFFGRPTLPGAGEALTVGPILAVGVVSWLEVS